MPARGGRRSSTHHSSVAPDEDVSMRSSNPGDVTVVADDPKYVLANSFLATMMREVIIDTAMLAHRNITRHRRAQGVWKGGCPVCKASCQGPADGAHAAHTNTQTVKAEGEESSSNASFSLPEGGTSASGSGYAVQPKGLEIYHNNPLLACLVCSRQVSANRYAQHLASCVGVGKGGAARRKGKNSGSSKVKTALENRKRAGFLLSGTSTPIQKSIDDTASGPSDDEGGRRSQKATVASSLGVNSNGKRSASPAEGADAKKQRNSTPPLNAADGTLRTAQPFFGASALAASQPPTGSPLNPHRHNKTARGDGDEDEGEGDEDEEEEDDGDDEEEEEEESAVALSREPSRSKLGQSSSILSGGDDDGSDSQYEDESASDENQDKNNSDDGSYVQSKQKGNDRSASPSVQSDADDDY